MKYSTASSLALALALSASPLAFAQTTQPTPAPSEEMQPAQPEAAQSAEESQAGQTATEQPADQDMAAAPPGGDPMANIEEDMKRVIDKHAELGAKPLAELSVEEARAGPTIADAVQALMAETTASTTPDSVTTKDMMITGAAGEIPARIYTPAASGDGPHPVIVYFHGGGWVIADIDVYDASARALAEKTGAIVVSAHYRQAPENPFPASHDDAVAAYKWVVENSGEFNGDSTRVAVAGESAGGGLAAHVAIQAREQQLTEPVHQLLIYPIAGIDMAAPSYQENALAKPLDKPGMEWFFDKVFTDPAQKADPRVDLVGAADLEGVAPATVITAQIDPLRSEGELLAEKLQSSGVETQHRNWEGSTHEFFGTATVVADAREAQDFAAERLMAAFAMDAGQAQPTVKPAVDAEQPAAEGEPAAQ